MAETCTRHGVCAVDHDTCNGYPRINSINAGRLLRENHAVSRSYESCHTPQGDRCEPDAPESIAARAQQDKEREEAGYDLVKTRRARRAPPPPDAGLKEPVKKWEDTFSAVEVMMNHFFPDVVTVNGEQREHNGRTLGRVLGPGDPGYRSGGDESAKAYDANKAAARSPQCVACDHRAGTCYECTHDIFGNDLTKRRDPIAEAVAAVRKLEDDAAIAAAYASLAANPSAVGRFTIARLVARAAVQAVRDLRQ